MSEQTKLRASIITPFFNAGDFIDETIASVLRQSRLPDEIIIVDDGTTDEHSLTRLEELEKNNLITVFHQKNAGVGAALTNGAQHARGDVIFEVDSDDILGKDYIGKFMAAFERDDSIDGVTCGYNLFFDGSDWDDPKNIHRTYMPEGLIVPRVFFENCAGGQNSAFRKSALEKIGYWDKRFSTAQDWGVWLQFLEYKLKQFIIPEYLYYYRVRKGSLLQSGSKDYDLDKNLAISMGKVMKNDGRLYSAKTYDQQKQEFKKQQQIIPQEQRKLQNNFSCRRVHQLVQEFWLSYKREGLKNSFKRVKNYIYYGVGKK